MKIERSELALILTDKTFSFVKSLNGRYRAHASDNFLSYIICFHIMDIYATFDNPLEEVAFEAAVVVFDQILNVALFCNYDGAETARQYADMFKNVENEKFEYHERKK